MSEVINLNQKRKAKARTDKDKKASENRRKFGRTKEEKQKEKLEAERAERLLQGHKRDPLTKKRNSGSAYSPASVSLRITPLFPFGCMSLGAEGETA